MNPENKAGQALAARERLWTERTPEQKFEALRAELIRNSRLIDDLLQLIRMLQTHSHLPGGQLVSPPQWDKPQYYSYRIPMSLRDKEGEA